MTKTEFKEMQYYALKQECAKRGIDSKGKKPELVERLEKYEGVIVDEGDRGELAHPVVVEKAPVPAPEPVKEIQVQDFRTERDKALDMEYCNPERIERLEQQVGQLFAGKGKFTINTENRTIKFDGGPVGPRTMTICCKDAEILREAQFYYKVRVHKGKNGLTSR